ncbi:PLP-dependent aminotransferase family protein [Alicyclobacillus sp.]|uniref:MocR-like pyridoxine biosynthesis transcription factor PdxR n=1 Tax=Alicyclobacillus sp. TaxID=61169 RepID=UPI0025BAB5E5|nr:PLP-dependent aminotransferase family protein [Alicyclobacillus sp.]MCL6517346.1 PLP-dependent aminotransferase family protein [Alicyclobacillus sp.]
MFIPLDRRSPTPLWQQLMAHIIREIDSGHLKAGEPLPPSRALALELGLSRSTVQTAYEELIARGYLRAARRAGTRVIAGNRNPDPNMGIRHTGELAQSPQFAQIEAAMKQWLAINEGVEAEIDFRHQEPLVDDRFRAAWRKAMLRAWDAAEAPDLSYTSSQGHEKLRSAVCHYLRQARGIHVAPEQVMITCGAQHAIDLVAQALLSPGVTAAVEDPGFPGARLPLLFRGINVVGVPVDEQGVVVQAIPNDARLVFVTPSHQRPTGAIMTVERRRELIRFARESGAWVIEDDFDGEFRYQGGPLPTLHSDSPECVLYLLAFSKLLVPGIRLAVLAGYAHVIKRIAAIQSLIQRHVPIVEQLTLCEFITQGEFAKHVQRLRKVYRNRHRALMRALREHGFDERFRIQGAEAGLHVFLEAEPGFDEMEALRRAAAVGVGLYPLTPYTMTSRRKGLLLGFARTDEVSIAEGIRRLKSSGFV